MIPFLSSWNFWFLLSSDFFAKFSSLKPPASHHTEPLKGLRLSMDCPSQRTVPLNGLDLSVDCPSHWTVPVKCFLHTEPSTDWTSHWTAPLNGLDLSRPGPLSGLDLSLDCSCSGLPDFLVKFFLKKLGLLDFLSRFERCSATNEKPNLIGWLCIFDWRRNVITTQIIYRQVSLVGDTKVTLVDP